MLLMRASTDAAPRIAKRPTYKGVRDILAQNIDRLQKMPLENIFPAGWTSIQSERTLSRGPGFHETATSLSSLLLSLHLKDLTELEEAELAVPMHK